jgi:hypothetical protein
MASGGQYSERPMTDGFRCPYCQAKRISAAALPCWLCGALLPAHDGPVPAAEPARGDNPALIALGVLALLIAVGLIIETPGLAILLAIALTPAFIRAAVASSHRQQAGQPMTGLEKVGAFLSSVGVVALVGLAAFVAFFSVCFAVCWVGLALEGYKGGEVILIASVGAGLVPAVFVFGWLIRKAWPRKGQS